jgi:hypothetical protein
MTARAEATWIEDIDFAARCGFGDCTEEGLANGSSFPKEDDVGEIPIFFLAKKIKAGIAVETKDVW